MGKKQGEDNSGKTAGDGSSTASEKDRRKSATMEAIFENKTI